MKQTPVQRLTFHATRHTFASQAFAAWMDPAWISRQLGQHSIAFTLETYGHLLPGARDLAAVDFGAVATSSNHRATVQQKDRNPTEELLPEVVDWRSEP